jgi:hypothetical protein
MSLRSTQSALHACYSSPYNRNCLNLGNQQPHKYLSCCDTSTAHHHTFSQHITVTSIPKVSNAMSYPPNSPEVVRRNPQHGIRVAGGSILTLLSLRSSPSYLMSARTIVCAEPDCSNKFDIVPHGFHAGLAGRDSAIHIKARCKACEPPVTVASWWEGYQKSEEGSEKWEEELGDWADEF